MSFNATNMNYKDMSREQLIRKLRKTEKRIKNEIKENRELYQSCFKNAPVPYQFLDKKGKILDVNQIWLKTLGYIRNEVLDRYFYELIHPDQISGFKENFKIFKENGEIHDIHFNLRHKKGHYINVSFEGYIGYDSEGNIIRIYCGFKDISRHKQLQESLDQVENHFRYLVQASVDHIFMLNKDGYYIISNDNVHQFGFNKGSQLVGRNVLEVHDLDTGKIYQDKIKEVIKTEKPVTFEHTHFTSDRKHYHIDTLYPILKNSKILGIGGICRDITDSKNKQLALEQKKAELSTILNNIPVTLVTIKKEEDRLRVSQVTNQHKTEAKNQIFPQQDYELLNCLRKDNPDRTCIFGINCEECNISNIILASFNQQKAYFQKEVKLALEKNKDRWYLISTVPIDIEGELRVLLAMLDITDRKLSEIQLRHTMQYLNNIEEKFREKSAQKLHDHVGQNLTGLNLNLNFMYSLLPAKAKEIVKDKYQDSKELLNDTMKSIRNLISEMRPSILEDYGLYAALEWYGEKFSERAGINFIMKGRELSARLSKDLETSLFRISQEILNNIVKHSRAENMVIELQEEDGKIYLNYQDDGIGFELKEARKRQDSTGLGILSMEDRVNALGGKLNIHSEIGKGTKIEIIMER
jgi:PAS domain S-box-containing protein